jgi:hypothetical protein
MDVEYKCSGCKKPIDRTAARCYRCGTVKSSSDPLARWAIAAAILAVPFAFVIWVAQYSPPAAVAAAPQPPAKVVEVDWHTKDESANAFYAIQGFVENRLKSPGSAQFAPVQDARVGRDGALTDQRYTIVAYVDSQNSFGALLRSNFFGEIQQTSKGLWTLKTLQIYAR